MCLVQDVDILVLSVAANPEVIKEMMAQNYSSFVLAQPAHNPQASYHALWYALSPLVSSDSFLKTCRIDVFVPGINNLPSIPPELTVPSRGSSLPVIPLLTALLHRVLAWVAHGQSQRAWSKQKISGCENLQRPHINQIWLGRHGSRRGLFMRLRRGLRNM
jgi:hypothetical protein